MQAFHQRELDAGRFLIQRCGACGRHVYYPREICPHCGSAALEWKRPSGLGTVHAVTTVRRKPAEGGDLNVSLIDLDEGVRLMSRVDEPGARLRCASASGCGRVQVKDGRGLVLFDAIGSRRPHGAHRGAAGRLRLENCAAAPPSPARHLRLRRDARLHRHGTARRARRAPPWPMPD